MLYSCLTQPFDVFSAFAGMTIPYPKREFLNDDDSDSKSSAAKVMECYWVNLSNIQERETNSIKTYPFYIILIRHQHLTKSCKCFQRYVNETDSALVKLWTNAPVEMKTGELCACAIWCKNAGYAFLFVSCMLS